MFFDTHMHSEFSFDSKMTVKEILEKQKELSIGITLTEHLDFDLEDFPIIDMKKYLNFYSKFKKDNFLVGIELGLAEKNSDKAIAFANEYKNSLDIIIGSVHSLYGQDIFFLMKDIQKPKQIVYKDYIENMLYCVKKFDFFDTLAHIDYISRYASYDDKNLYLHEFEDAINEILKTLIAKDKCLELNTRLIATDNFYNSLLAIFKRYRELGGKFVTLASDAHNKDSIGINFNIASKFLNECDLKAVYFKNRQRILI